MCLGGKERGDCNGDSRCQHEYEGQEPEEPDHSELDAIDKKVSPPGEVRGGCCSPVDTDGIARDKEREDETEAGKERDLAPRDCTPVHLSTAYDCLRIEGELDKRDREGEENEDCPSGPFSYERFLRIGE